MCSSSKDPHGSSLTIFLGFQTFRKKMEMDMMCDILDRSGTVSEFKGQTFFMEGSIVDISDSDSDSVSSLDLDFLDFDS